MRYDSTAASLWPQRRRGSKVAAVTLLKTARNHEFLKNIELFRLLDSSELNDLLLHTEAFHLGSGDRLFSEGDDADGLYVVERGEVEVRAAVDADRATTLAHLGNGSVIGEISLLAGGQRSATVEAFSPTSGFFLARSAFDSLRFSGNPAAFKVILQLARTLDDRRRALQDRFDQLKLDPEIGARLRERATRELLARVRKA